MFQFNVAKEAFVLHSKLVSRHSPALHALMCGHMMEAEEKQTFISDVDKDTFARFAEFIYGGDYNVAEALIVLDDLDTERRRSESVAPKVTLPGHWKSMSRRFPILRLQRMQPILRLQRMQPTLRL
jgi:hypothetical protein